MKGLARVGLLSLLAFSFLYLDGHGQTVWPYQLRKAKEWVLVGTGVGTNLAGIVLQSQTQGLSPLQIGALDPATVNGFDRGALNPPSSTAKALSNALPVAAGLSNGLLLADSTCRGHLPELLLMGTEGALLTLGINQTVKAVALRPRPYVYDPGTSWEEKGEKDARFSFFSQHTSLTGYFSFFAAKAYHDTHPHSRLRWLPWAGAGALTATAGYLRVKAGQHFPTDVIVGGIFGAAMGWGVLEIHKTRPSSKSSSTVSFFPVGNGVGVVWRF